MVVETARMEPSDEVLESIAAVTRFPIPFFHNGDIEVPSADGVSFRSMKSMTAGQRNAALAAGALAFELSEWINKRFELPQRRSPICETSDLKTRRPLCDRGGGSDYGRSAT